MSTHPRMPVEYKVVELSKRYAIHPEGKASVAEAAEPVLNKLAKEGWYVVSTASGYADTLIVTLERQR